MRRYLANAMCLAGFCSVPAGVWIGAGVAAGLISAGAASIVYGLVFVDVDKGGAEHGESAT
jgi:hypothetical protein